MRSSVPLFDGLAEDYDAHFAAVHRRAYDDLAWELVQPLAPERGTVVDAGCGVGRWAARWAALGHEVIGIEQAPRMARRARERLPADHCTVVESPMEDARLPGDCADLVAAMGSVQYTRDPRAAVARFARWVRPGGWVAVLVDSRVGIVVEKLRDGLVEDALDAARTRRGTWSQRGMTADLHLLDRHDLEAAFRDAGLVDVRTAGLLVTAGLFGRAWLMAELERAPSDVLTLERRLRSEPALADLGKHLLVVGRRACEARRAGPAPDQL